MIAMSYGYIYVAQVSLGADKNQLIKAIVEAESYPGPSLIIAYAPCISHGINMTYSLDQAKIIKAIVEAESYPGPSLIIAYAPCISHGINMTYSLDQAKKAVDSGYWQLYRYNPALEQEGKNPFILDSKEPTSPFKEFLESEVRYTSLKRAFPEIAEELFDLSEKDAKKRLDGYKKLAGM